MNQEVTLTRITSFFLLLMLCGCARPSGDQAVEQRAKYFSLKQYMTGQLSEVQRQPGSGLFQKIITLNGKTDTAVFSDTAALKTYFQPFINADIDKPALEGTYRIEQTADDQTGNLTILYTSTGKNTQPYQVQLQLDSGHNIKTLNIISWSHNLIYDIRKNLFYEPGRMIQITKDEKLILMPEKKLNIKILFRAPALST